MKIQIIKVTAREPRGRMGLAAPYLRGRETSGQVLTHVLAYADVEEYLLVDGQTIPEEIIPMLHERYPGSERVVNVNLINTLNMKPTPLCAEFVTVEIAEERDEGGEMRDESPNPGNHDEDPFADYSYADLRDLCKKAGLPSFGLSRKKLVTALAEAGVAPAA